MEPLVSTGAHWATSLDEALTISPITLICVSSYSMTSYLPGMDDVFESLIEVKAIKQNSKPVLLPSAHLPKPNPCTACPVYRTNLDEFKSYLWQRDF